MTETIFTAEEAAKYLRLLDKQNKPDQERVKNLARQRKLGHIRAGRSYLFREEHLEQYLKDNEVAVVTPKKNPRGLTNASLDRLQRG